MDGGGFFVIGWMIYRVPSTECGSNEWATRNGAPNKMKLGFDCYYKQTTSCINEIYEHTYTNNGKRWLRDNTSLSIYQQRKKRKERRIQHNHKASWNVMKIVWFLLRKHERKKLWPRRERPKSDWPGVNVTEYLLSASFYRWKWLAEAHTPYAFSSLSHFPVAVVFVVVVAVAIFFSIHALFQHPNASISHLNASSPPLNVLALFVIAYLSFHWQSLCALWYINELQPHNEPETLRVI